MNNPKKITAIIVDDSDLMRAVLRAILDQINIDVIGEANNGRDGVDMADRLIKHRDALLRRR